VVQEALIREGCARRGLRLVGIVGDETAGPERPALDAALERIADGEAACLVVSGLDRLGRSAVDLARVLRRVDTLDAALVALDFDLDTSTREGRLAAHVLAGVGAMERERISAGTRTALAAARAEGRPISRPAVSDQPQLRERIAALRASGMTLQAIADTLNAEGVPTLRGGALWRPSSVQAAVGYKRPSRKDARRPHS
jgi:DNA invertase Pin-like site-specific DNA recombinase